MIASDIDFKNATLDFARQFLQKEMVTILLKVRIQIICDLMHSV